MDRITRSPASRVAAAVLVILSLAGGGYFFLPSGAIVAQAPAPAAPPAEALNQANTLSDAFRNSAEKVLPAVVSIRNEVHPKIAKAEPKSPRGGTRPQLPKGFGGELDPFLKTPDGAARFRCERRRRPV